jgi:hypothetical protein
MKDTKYHPSSSVRRPSGLTVHTCGENRVILPQRLTFFYCRRYIKRKEIVLPSTSDSMPVVSTMLYTLKVLTMLCALHVQVQYNAGPENMCKKTRKKYAGEISWEVYLASRLTNWAHHVPFWELDQFLIHFINACKLLACSTAELQHFSSTCSWVLFRLVRAKRAKRWPKRLKYRFSFHRHFMGNLLSYKMNKLYRGLTPLNMKGDHFSKSSLS